MQQTMLPEETRNVRKNRSRVHRWIAGGMSCVMSLCTVLSLVAPAFAQENETAAEPHTHTESCYQQVTEKTEKTLSCNALSLAYDGADGETADFVVHAHSGLCYDETGALVCTLPEKEAHTHGDGCYTTADTHIHDDSCYDMDAELVCGKTAHTHSDACYACAQEGEEGHTHDDTCRTLTCTAEEHTHEAACHPLTCTQSTESAKLTCTKEEVILHTHGDACYGTYTDETGAEQKRLTCTQQEIKEHVHTDACFTTTTEPVDTTALTCTEDHEHTALCYGTWELVCGLEETAAENAEPEGDDEWSQESEFDYENYLALKNSGFFEYWEQFMNEEEEESENKSSNTFSLRNARARTTAVNSGNSVNTTNGNDPSDVQIPNDGWGGSTQDGNGDGITLSKSIDGTNIENVFDITLEVQTTEDVQEITKDPSMAVVVVMDISNTMMSDISGGEMSKYQAAMLAAEKFVDMFAEKTTGVSQIGYVAFNTDATEICRMQPCYNGNMAKSLKNEMRADTDAILAQYSDNAYYGRTRFTNIEAGLHMAYDMLKNVDSDHKFVVFLSDGLPTTWEKSKYLGYNPNANEDGVFYDKIHSHAISTGFLYAGTNYSDTGAIRARQMATGLKKIATVYSVGVDVGGFGSSYIQEQLARANNEIYVVENQVSSAGMLEMVKKSFTNWLKEDIGSNQYVSCTSTENLISAYEGIFNELITISQATTQELWKVTDPVPSELEFIGFVDNGTLRQQLSGKSVESGQDTISITGNTISWDLKESGYVSSNNNGAKTYTYSVTYRVRLKNEVAGFEESKEYVTNGNTVLRYKTLVTTNGVKQYSDTKYGTFLIPKVEGYLGELEFTKVDQNNNAVAGAEFTLTHDKKNCYNSQCRGDNSTAVEITPMKEESGTDGEVKFKNIPSGHTYMLEETKAPNGYASASEKYTVQVSYDTVTVTKYDTEEAWGGSVTNTLLEAELTVKGTKHLTNPDGAEHTYTFEMVKVADAQGTAIEGAKVETATATLSGETSEATFTFPKLTYYGTELGTDTTKTYYYKISEQEKDSSALDADDTIYVLTVTVTRSGNTLSANVTHVNGKAVTGEDPVVSFTNTLLGELEIEKDLILLSGLPDADKAFKVKVELTGDLLKKGMVLSEGTVVETDGSATVEVTVKDNGSKVTIGKIPAGTKYKVTEAADSAYGYAVSYSVKDGEGTITAKADGKDNASVVITNKELKTELEIPALKKLTNPDGKKHTYAFKLTQVDKDGNVLSDGETQNAYVTMKEDEASAEFVLTYKGTDLNGERDRTYYYLVEETTKSDLYLDADASTFLLEVKLSGGDNQLTAEVVRVNGQSVSGETPVLTFTNTLLGTITLEKTLVGATHVGPFTFDLTGEIADGEYRAVRNGDKEVVTFKNGKATVKLMLNDTLTIYGIPHGTAITIQEYVGADEVRYTINGSIWKHSGYTAETEVTTSGTTVRYINYYYGDLPQTGQLNWPILLLAVLGVGCLGAGAFLRFRRKKGKYE